MYIVLHQIFNEAYNWNLNNKKRNKIDSFKDYDDVEKEEVIEDKEAENEVEAENYKEAEIDKEAEN